MKAMYSVKNNDLILDESHIKNVKQYVLKVRDLPYELQPRQKMLGRGPAALSMVELLAIILNVGTTKEGVLEMAGRIMREYGERSIVSETDVYKLSKELDIPFTKACQIIACGEIGRRVYQKSETGFKTIRTAKDVFEYAQDMRNLPKEHLRGIYLNTHHRVIHDEVVSIGTINSSIIHPREVFRPAIEYNAAAVILVHNHPSNNVEASAEDVDITKQLIEAGKLIGINLLDHVIITRDEFTSIDAKYL
jgi:DNA repair protein RadC